ncbi:MAG: AraC family transcriptional regulator ligand-binding domain-containing protein [Marinobacter sp.]
MTIATQKHSVPVSQVHNILQGARNQNLDVKAVLLRAGIPPLLLDVSRSQVSHAQFGKLLQVLRHQMKDEFWGLCSHPVRLGTFAQCCELLVHATTLEAALRAGFHFYHLILQDFTVRLQRDGKYAWIRLHTHNKDCVRSDFAERIFMFFAYGLASWLTEERLPVVQVYLCQPRSTEKPLSSLLYNAPVFHDQNFNGFCIDIRLLDRTVRQDARSLCAFLQRSPEDLLVRYRDRSRTTERVKRYLRQHLTEGSVPVEHVAEALGMKPYSLRRKLRFENERYQTIKDEVRCDAAIDWLTSPNLSLAEVGERLGFSEQSTFHRAFKKWTGLTPGEYRDRDDTELDSDQTPIEVEGFMDLPR